MLAHFPREGARSDDAQVARSVAIILDGNVIRLTIPELTEERRRDLVRIVRKIAEEGRISVRNVRRDVMHDLRELKDDGDVGADEEHRAEERVQKLTDEHVKKIDDMLKHKEAEIMEV